MRIDAAIFDLDDTLYAYAPCHEAGMEAAGRAADAAAGIKREEFLPAFRAARGEIHDALRGTAAQHNRLLYFQRALEKLGVSGAHALTLYDAYWDTFLSRMTLAPGVAELLAALRGRGVPTGICSDLTAHIQHRKMARLGLWEYIGALVTSEEAGAEKPSPRMFGLILGKLGVTDRAHAWFVGDSLEKDALGACAAGMRAVHLSIGALAGMREKDGFSYCAASDFSDIAAMWGLEAGNERE